MELDLGIVVIVLIAAILLLIFTIRRNYRDRKDFEEKIKKTELGTDEHKSDRI